MGGILSLKIFPNGLFIPFCSGGSKLAIDFTSNMAIITNGFCAGFDKLNK